MQAFGFVQLLSRALQVLGHDVLLFSLPVCALMHPRMHTCNVRILVDLRASNYSFPPPKKRNDNESTIAAFWVDLQMERMAGNRTPACVGPALDETQQGTHQVGMVSSTGRWPLFVPGAAPTKT